jgi:putative ABC transport system ATP-binding protein
MFRFENVTQIKKVNGKGLTILSDICMQIQPGQTTAFMGPSGAGKSSLLRLFNRMDDPVGGAIFWREKPLNGFNVIELRRKVGMVFQTPIMFPGTVGDNISYSVNLQNRAVPASIKDPGELLEQVGLSCDLVSRPADQLSGGQQQRVAFARTLANAPEVLLLDEPTASLDPTSAREIMNLTRQLQSTLGITIIMITHSLEQAREYSDYLGLLQEGRLLEFNRTEKIFEAPQHPATKSFISGKGEK